MNFVLVALLATVVMWLYDLNVGGVLNMTPKGRENLAKALAYNENTPIGQSDDANTNDENDTDDATRIDPALRNKYLKRIGVESANSSDCEPLLNQ